jgi:oxygen-independent coproporphyrinogen III oxidase
VNTSTWGIYVHVPWCRVRCPYCAFYVQPDRHAAWSLWAEAVVREYRLRQSDFGGRANTLYIGGGTPSRLPIPDLDHLIGEISLQPGAEVTAEANPEDIEDTWLDGAVAAGVNRISLGIQTFNKRFARLLNRAHSVERASEVAARVSQAGLRSWSVDLMFALPGQTLDDLRVDLEQILAINPPHVSLYGLTIEAGTPFERARDRGQLVPPSDDLWREMYDLLVSRLENAGLKRYEVSNFAREGHRSQHNASYWKGCPYMGLGPSAHGLLPDGRRYVNIADALGYPSKVDPTASLDTPSPKEAAVDLLVSGLRATEGISLRKLGVPLRPEAISHLVRGGLLTHHEDQIALTPEAFPICDAVVGRLVEALQGG